MALVTVQRKQVPSDKQEEKEEDTEEADGKRLQRKRSSSQSYFTFKGSALILGHDEIVNSKVNNRACAVADMQKHLQSMFYLLRPEDTLKIAVKLESAHPGRMRYIVVVAFSEESCVLGIDCNPTATIGLVLPIWATTITTLDGDGGFSVSSVGRHHLFKPISVQAMWSALQTLNRATGQAGQNNHYPGGHTHSWIEYYESRVTSDQSCLNEWNFMDDLVSRRPPSPDLRQQPAEREATERLLHAKLKELMMSVDLDEVTCKFIRNQLEEELNMNLKEFKPFIDQDMLTILGQMDAPAQIFEYLFLGSEWNASNFDQLRDQGVGHILNVTREIDNFFPGTFDYLNIRVYDDEMTELLPYWDKTYRYISKIKDTGSKVLVHCKMGISRSASVVIAYVMKAYGWKLEQALQFVKDKRNCIKPNVGFLKQLEIYEGILDASQQRHNSIWRSKSEANLQSCDLISAAPDSLCLPFNSSSSRPKSWSPDDSLASLFFPVNNSETELEADDALSGPSIKNIIVEFEASQPSLGQDEASCPLEGTSLYDKEDIPWTPGTVLQTKLKLEEKCLKRASSYESLLLNVPMEGNLQRSQSLRYPTADGGVVKRITQQLENKIKPEPANPSLRTTLPADDSFFSEALYQLLPAPSECLKPLNNVQPIMFHTV